MQREQHLSGLASRQFGYPLSFRGQVCWVHRPFPCFPPMVLLSRRLPSLLRVPASPVPRSQQYYEGATTSHPRISGRLLFRFRRPRDPSAFVSRLSAPGRSKVPSRPGPFLFRLPCSGCFRVDANGISQVFRRSFLCLCSVPGPRSNRRVLAMTVTPVLPPRSGRRRLRHWLISGLTRSFGTRCHTLHAWCCHHTCKACFRLAGCAFAGRELNPLDRYERFQFALTIILLSCSPDATGCRFAPSGLRSAPKSINRFAGPTRTASA